MGTSNNVVGLVLQGVTGFRPNIQKAEEGAAFRED